MELAFIDLETTGLNPVKDRITEITIKIIDEDTYEETCSFSSLVNPEIKIPSQVSELTGITNEMTDSKPSFDQISHKVFDMVNGKIIVGHNVKFDISFLDVNLARAGIDIGSPKYICTCEIERNKRGKHGNKLSECLARRGIKIACAHRSSADVNSTIELFKQQKIENAKIIKNKYKHNNINWR